ncbi:protein serine/threonine phosphatase 2C [Fistulina hepatica ATCC 64428]|uniref:Protein serine/threonine phosphatase 2C n=1 Tax=Fistulina hepatica ATCC 64428 TaxID=1128425 RepID=A0A0D7A871_9AGAR|nr:protein serine/threonine phosphatase 2C [Fistulina hepatica ATCC 64428]
MSVNVDKLSSTPVYDRQHLESLFLKKSSNSHDVVSSHFDIYQATFQAFKSENEDRTTIVHCAHGTLVAVFDGHCSAETSEYVVRTLPQILCDRLDAALVADPDPSRRSEIVTEALINGIEEFDRSLLTVVQDMFKDCEKLPGPEDTEDIFNVFGWTKQDENYKIARHAVVGSTALIGFFDKDAKELWVACLGDSESHAGRLSDSGIWEATMLNDIHNASDPQEAERLRNDHPGEDDLIKGRHVLGMLQVTRGTLGDYLLKADQQWRDILQWAYPTPLPHYALNEWRTRKMSFPYLLSTPTVRHWTLAPGDIVVFATDGVRDAQIVEGMSHAERGALLISLAAGQTTHPASIDSKGHSFLPLNQGENVATNIIKNLLFGTDDTKMAREIIAPPDADEYMLSKLRIARDDISVVVVKVA